MSGKVAALIFLAQEEGALSGDLRSPRSLPQPFHLDESGSSQHLQRIGGKRLAEGCSRY
jgi:hypothetical protein